MFARLHHVQLTMPCGEEAAARAFYYDPMYIPSGYCEQVVIDYVIHISSYNRARMSC